MKRRFFIAGTDTDIGKTWVAAQFMRELKQAEYTVAGLKPIAAGGAEGNESRNEDAVRLQSLSSIHIPYEHVNPFFFDKPIAPHIAAEQQGVSLTVKSCLAGCRPLLEYEVDLQVVEGAGGWLVPINDRESMAELAKALECSIILVVGMRLGCINHALLTVDAIRQSGLRLAGWVANFVDPNMDVAGDNQSALAKRIDAPLLASIPFQGESMNSSIQYFDLSLLGL